MTLVYSPANIAFIKHWGMSLDGLPLAPSLSMNLSSCFTITEILPNLDTDEDLVFLHSFNGEIVQLQKNLDSRDDKVFAQIERIRSLSNNPHKVIIRSKNSFPTKAGIASSASGFSALTTGLLKYFKVESSLQETANLTAKAGSMSAVRSLGDYFSSIELSKDGKIKLNQCPEFIDLDLIDLVVVVTEDEKTTSSYEGQKVAETSPLFYDRLSAVKSNFKAIKKEAKANNVTELGRLIELESNMLHSVMQTSSPSQIYMNWKTWKVIEKVLELRSEGVEAYFTVDAGSNVHVITTRINYEVVFNHLNSIPEVINIIDNQPCLGTRIIKLSDIDGFYWN